MHCKICVLSALHWPLASFPRGWYVPTYINIPRCNPRLHARRLHHNNKIIFIIVFIITAAAALLPIFGMHPLINVQKHILHTWRTAAVGRGGCPLATHNRKPIISDDQDDDHDEDNDDHDDDQIVFMQQNKISMHNAMRRCSHFYSASSFRFDILFHISEVKVLEIYVSNLI